MKYTIDDLRGKYVKVGTPGYDVFIHACDVLGIRWSGGELAQNKYCDKECIALNSRSEHLGFSTLDYYQNTNCWDLFVPKTDAAQRTAESSAVKTLESLGYVWNGGEQWKPPIGNAPSYITDEIDNTVTQRGERYGLFADGVKYERTLVGLCGTHVKTDVYRVLDAFNTGDPILDHLIKKALCAGSRGHKDKLTDYRNIVESAEKALKLLEQKQNGN